MKRLLSVAAAALLLFSVTSTTDAHWKPYKHWHYGSSYFVTNDSLGTWQVVTYYSVKLNGSSPGYIPSVQLTEPLECRVPYAGFTTITITYCAMDRLTQYNPDRWRITTRWRACVLFLPICAEHGHSRTMLATGSITARGSW